MRVAVGLGATIGPRPLRPESDLSRHEVRNAAMGQRQTHAAQQLISSFDHSSARIKSVGGIVNPSALAVFRLMTRLIELDALLDGEVSRFGAPENFSGVGPYLLK